MENVTYNCTLTYGTCKSPGSLYSFCINVYNRSYFLLLPIIDLINQDGEPTMPFKVATGTKSSVSHLCVLFFLCVVQKATAHVGTKAFKICHQAQKCFRGIFIGIPQHQKGYCVYVTCTRNKKSSYDVF